MVRLLLGLESCGTIHAVIPLWMVCVSYVNACVMPETSGFYGCGANTGQAAGLMGSFSVSSISACVRLCAGSSPCAAVAVQTASMPRNCELFSAAERCEDVGARPGYQYFIQIKPFHKCFAQAAVVKGAMRTGNNTYMLFFDASRQEFALENGVLQAVGCPKPNQPYFHSWPTDTVKAMFRSDVLGTGERFYIIHGTTVEQYFLLESMAVPSSADPWPVSISDLFGPEITNSIRAVVEKDDKLHVIASDGVYVYRARGPFEDFGFSLVETVPPMYGLSEFWDDITAAIYTSSPKVSLIFTGKSYILYNETKDRVVGRGLVCSNSR